MVRLETVVPCPGSSACNPLPPRANECENDTFLICAILRRRSGDCCRTPDVRGIDPSKRGTANAHHGRINFCSSSIGGICPSSKFRFRGGVRQALPLEGHWRWPHRYSDGARVDGGSDYSGNSSGGARPPATARSSSGAAAGEGSAAAAAGTYPCWAGYNWTPFTAISGGCDPDRGQRNIPGQAEGGATTKDQTARGCCRAIGSSRIRPPGR